MNHFIFKILLSAVVISGVSELAKRYSLLAAILASLPLTSILAMTWLYWDTGSIEKVSELSRGILWAVLPSLLFFFVFPVFAKTGFKFGTAMFLSCLVMIFGYSAYAFIFKKMGIQV